MASGYDVAGPEAADAFAGLPSAANYGGEGFNPNRGPQSLASEAAAQAQAAEEQARQEAKSQGVFSQLLNYFAPNIDALTMALGASPSPTYGTDKTHHQAVVDAFNSLISGVPSQRGGLADPNIQSIPTDPAIPSNVMGTPQTIGTPTATPTVDDFSELTSIPSTPTEPTQPNLPYDPGITPTYPALTDALKEVNKIDPSKTLTGDAAQLAAYRTMGYTPEMASGWEAARNTAGDLVAGILQGLVPGGGVAEILAPDTTKGIRGDIAKGIDDLFGTHAPERNPWSPTMDRQTFVDLAADIPSTTSGFRGPPIDDWSGGDDGNVQAIRRFLQDPTYGNIPQIDPASALAAYENAIRGIDAVVGERGFTDRGFAQAARDRSKTIFDEFQAGQDFDSMLNEKIGRAFADEALFNKDIELRGQGVQAVEQAFPQGFESDIFNPEAFSKAAENIYGQKLQGAQDVIARAGSRGQLSPRGGRLASESLLSQGPDVQSRLTDILGGVRSEAEGGFGDIRGSALEAAQGYQLGDELFDVTPFADQAAEYTRNVVGELPGRISTAVGTDPLFSAVSALQEGGRQQGVVSGTPSFLDVLAEREGTPGTGRDRRGLGSRGSGVF